MKKLLLLTVLLCGACTNDDERVPECKDIIQPGETKADFSCDSDATCVQLTTGKLCHGADPNGSIR